MSMNFFENHPPLVPSAAEKRKAELADFAQALAGAEAAIEERRRQGSDEWRKQQRRLHADARAVIEERGGDPDDEDLGDD